VIDLIRKNLVAGRTKKMAVNMIAIEAAVKQYEKRISEEETYVLRDMAKSLNISLKSPWAMRKTLIKSLVDFHRQDEIRREKESEGRSVIHRLYFKTKWARGRFFNLYLKNSGLECVKEDSELEYDIYNECEYDEEYIIEVSGELPAEIRQAFEKTTSAIEVISVIC
jgi:hypothetical protein